MRKALFGCLALLALTSALAVNLHAEHQRSCGIYALHNLIMGGRGSGIFLQPGGFSLDPYIYHPNHIFPSFAVPSISAQICPPYSFTLTVPRGVDPQIRSYPMRLLRYPLVVAQADGDSQQIELYADGFGSYVGANAPGGYIGQTVVYSGQPQVRFLALGMTASEVTRLLGRPEWRAPLRGGRELWRYDGMNLTFESGKLTHVRFTY